MSERRHAFEYALLRVVPRIERGEQLNAGLLLYCKGLDYLGAAVHLDLARLHALDPTADGAAIARALRSAADVCDEGPAAESHRDQRADRRTRFRWLTAPRSTVVQPGPVHTGLTLDPAAELDRLMGLLVYQSFGSLPDGR